MCLWNVGNFLSYNICKNVGNFLSYNIHKNLLRLKTTLVVRIHQCFIKNKFCLHSQNSAWTDFIEFVTVQPSTTVCTRPHSATSQQEVFFCWKFFLSFITVFDIKILFLYSLLQVFSWWIYPEHFFYIKGPFTSFLAMTAV